MANQQLQRLAARLRGQRRWTERLGREAVDYWTASGLSGIAAARELGVDAQRLYWWRDRLGLAHDDAPEVCALPSQFVPVVVREDAGQRFARPSLVVEVGDGLRVEVYEADAATAAWLARFTASVRETEA
jgi:transposase-like protein